MEFLATLRVVEPNVGGRGRTSRRRMSGGARSWLRASSLHLE